MTNPLALLQVPLDGLSHHLIGGIVAAVGAYGATRFLLGKLVATVSGHEKRLDALEEDSKLCNEERGYIKGHLNI